MSNLLSTLMNTAGSLEVFQRSLTVIQNNVANASTPGYARQTATLLAAPYDPQSALQGGVRFGTVANARDEFCEAAVQRQSAEAGYDEQRVSDLQSVEALFPVDGQSGVPGALNKLLDSFSAWSLKTNDPLARQTVLDRAGDFAQAVQTVSNGLNQARSDADRALRGEVDTINRLADRVRDLNVRRNQGNQQDAGLDTEMHNTLEELSSHAGISTLRSSDGAVTVMMGGSVPLVLGEHLWPISLAANNAGAQVLSAQGQDVTASATGGRLGGLLDTRNRLLPGVSGKVDAFAQGFADQANTILTGGLVSAGPPPVAGTALFTYNPIQPGSTMQVQAGLKSRDLAAIDPGAASEANGIALKLAGLSQPQIIGGVQASYTQYYSALASQVGGELSASKSDASLNQEMLTQAQNIRKERSGVSLDQEAAALLEFQRAYEATARMLKTLGDLTEEAINILK